MKRRNVALTAIAVVAAIGSAFAASKMRAQANVYTQVTAPCHLILCNTNTGTGACIDPNQKFRNPQCTVPVAQAFNVPSL